MFWDFCILFSLYVCLFASLISLFPFGPDSCQLYYRFKIFTKNFGGFLQYSKKPFFHNLKIDWYISNLIFLDLFLFPFLTRCLIILALFCWFLISSLFLIILARISKCFDSRSDWWYWFPRLENLSFCHLCIKKSKSAGKALKLPCVRSCLAFVWLMKIMITITQTIICILSDLVFILY